MRRTQRITAQEVIRRLTNIETDESEGEEEIQACGDEEEMQVIEDEEEVYTESESEDDHSSDFEESGLVGKDKTKWQVLSKKALVGRRPSRNVFKATPGCNARAKRSVIFNDYLSAFSLIFDFAMINIIIKNTIEEARRRGDATWSIDKGECLALLGILRL